MKNAEAFEINWEVVGAKLAALTSTEQSAFFNGFAEEFGRYDSQYAREMQLLHVQDGLRKKVVETLKKNLPMLWYKEGDE